jgi:hypothetical protein
MVPSPPICSTLKGSQFSFKPPSRDCSSITRPLITIHTCMRQDVTINHTPNNNNKTNNNFSRSTKTHKRPLPLDHNLLYNPPNSAPRPLTLTHSPYKTNFPAAQQQQQIAPLALSPHHCPAVSSLSLNLSVSDTENSLFLLSATLPHTHKNEPKTPTHLVYVCLSLSLSFDRPKPHELAPVACVPLPASSTEQKSTTRK